MTGQLRNLQDPLRILLLLIVLHHFLCLSNANLIGVTFYVPEHTQGNTWIGNILKSLAISTQEIHSMIIESPPQKEWSSFVHINTQTGDIRTSPESKTTLDRETICPLNSTNSPVSDCEIAFLISVNKRILVSLHLVVTDINDSPPIFFRNGQILRELIFNLSENAPVGVTTLPLPNAVDPDVVSSPTDIFYHLIGENLPFDLVRFSGSPQIRVTTALDYERIPVYNFYIQACEKFRGDDLCSSLYVTVNIHNVNDHKPAFVNTTYKAVIDEDTPPGATVLTVQAKDDDAPPFGNISYLLVNDKASEEVCPFGVDQQSGRIFVKSSTLEPGKYSFIIEASDDLTGESTSNKRASTLVVIFVADVNNHRPEIELKPFHNTSTPYFTTIGSEFVVEVQEEVKEPTVLAYLTVTDEDEGANALCSCHLKESPISSHFELKKVNQISTQMNVYRLVAIKPIDAENSLVLQEMIEPNEVDRCKGVAGFLSLNIVCSDSGNKPLDASVAIHIALQGIDEFPTTFVFRNASNLYRISVSEDTKVGTRLLKLETQDKDTGQCLDIDLNPKSSQFIIEPESETVVLAQPLDYEESSSISLTVYSKNPENTYSGLGSTSAMVVIDVINVNDNKPRLTSLTPLDKKACGVMSVGINETQNPIMDCFSIDVEEEIEIGAEIDQLVAFDIDTPNATMGFVFSLLGTYAPLRFQGMSRLDFNPVEVTKGGGLTVKSRLDREEFAWLDLIISISDGEEASVNLLRINLLDVNDNHPVWKFPSTNDYHISVSIHTEVNAVVSRVQALDADSGLQNGGILYKILPQRTDITVTGLMADRLAQSLYGSHLFAIDQHTGKLSVKQALPNQTETPYRLDLLASDRGKPPLESTAHLLISLVDKPFTEMQVIQQSNPLMNSNNVQNDGTEMFLQVPLNSPKEVTDAQGTPGGLESWIHIIGIAAGVLTLIFFIAIMSFVLSKKMQSGSRSLCQKPQEETRSRWASSVQEIPIERRGPLCSSPLSIVEVPATSIAFEGSGVPSKPGEVNGPQSVPVIVSLAVLPQASTSANAAAAAKPASTEYLVISDCVPHNVIGRI